MKKIFDKENTAIALNQTIIKKYYWIRKSVNEFRYKYNIS